MASPKASSKNIVWMAKANPIKTESIPAPAKVKIAEAGKGKLKLGKLEYPKDLGEKHFEDYDDNEQIVKGVPQVSAQIDTTVDYIMKGGFFVTTDSDNDKVLEVCEKFMKKQNFDILLRTIIRHMLIYGNAFVEIVRGEGENEGENKGPIEELKVWNPKHIYVKRNENAEVEHYSQWYGLGQKTTEGKPFETFEPDELAHFKFNVIGNDAYGTSLIFPLIPTVKRKLSMEKSMETLLRRKANAPMIVNVGDEKGEYIPKKGDLQAIANDLAVMKDDTEWVFNKFVNVTALGFQGKILDLQPFAEYWDRQIMYGGRVPDVLLGKGSIPEGLARIQLEVFDSRAKSIKEAVEKILENDIFSVLLESEGIKDTVEFEWGQAGEEEIREEVTTLKSLLDSRLVIPDSLRLAVSDRIAELLKVKDEMEKYEQELEKEKEEEPEEPPQPPQGDKGEGEGEEEPEGEPPKKQPLKKPPKKERKITEAVPLMSNSSIAPMLENKFLNDLYAMNQDAAERVLKLVNDFNESLKIKEDIPKNKYSELVNKIARELDVSFEDAEKIVGGHVKDSYMAGLGVAETRLDMDIGMGRFERDSIRILQKSGAMLVKDVSEEAKKKISFEISQGIMSQEGIPEIRRRISGVFDVNKNRLDNIARTEVSRALTEAELNGYERSKVVDMVEWIVASDERLCSQCAPMEGKIFDINEARGKIPLHPRCRCDFVPVVE